MSLNGIWIKAVKTLDKATKSIQEPITLRRWTAIDNFGKITAWAPDITLRAVVGRKQTEIHRNGRILKVQFTLSIFEPLAPLAGREEKPLDTRDVIIMADGLIVAVMDVQGPTKQPTVDQRHFLQVMVG